jgi:enoyl-CoA hydratase/carnithine racemase
MTEETVEFSHRDDIAVMTINRPDKLNALNPRVMDDLEAAMDRFEASSARIGVLTGAGRAFVAGADIGQYVDLTIHDYRDFMVRGRALHDRFVHSPKVVIAAIEGYALGGGLEIALCCDLIVAARDAGMGLPEVKLGLLPGGGGTQRLTRIVGPNRALDLIATGRIADAEELERWGVVNRVVEPGTAVEAAIELAHSLGRRAPRAVRLAKRLIRDGADGSLETALTLEQAETAALYGTEDAREGIAAFVEKRRPRFEDR